MTSADRQCLSSGPYVLPSPAAAVCPPACKPHTSYTMGTQPLSPIRPFLSISAVKCLIVFSSSRSF